MLETTFREDYFWWNTALQKARFSSTVSIDFWFVLSLQPKFEFLQKLAYVHTVYLELIYLWIKVSIFIDIGKHNKQNPIYEGNNKCSWRKTVIYFCLNEQSGLCFAWVWIRMEN